MKTEKLYYGAAYYDEYMPYDRLDTDMQMMKDAGMNLIRIAESTWSTWEPEDGVFDFTHLHRMLAASQKAGIDVIIGTPTYAIPPWLVRKYPDILAVTHDGPSLYGHRQNMDITHPGYLKHAERMIRRLMEEVMPYPHIIGFQIDNETKPYDTCGTRVQQMFVEHLRRRFPDIDAFNDEFGLNYWSNRVQHWADMPDVRGTINGSLAAEFEDFQRDLVTRFFHWQADIIREYKRPEQFLTHNFDFSWRDCSFGYQPDANQYDAAVPLDVAGADIYHRTEDELTGAEISFGGDVARSLKKGSYFVLETEAQGNHGWLAYPGQLRLQAFSHLASGANCVEYWHWHSIHNSFESYWKGVLSHNLKENATYRECKTIGADFARLSDTLCNLTKKNKIAMMLSNRSNTAFKHFPAGNIKDHNTLVRWLYDAFYRMNLALDMINEDETELSQYDLILLPSLYVMSDAQIERLRAYVENGGHILATIRTAFSDTYTKIYADDQPHGLRACFGMTYDQFTAPGSTGLCSDVVSFQKKPVLSDWIELLIPDSDTKVIARYEHPYWKEYAAVTCHNYGQGAAAYIGCYFDGEALEDIVRALLPYFGVALPDAHFPLICKHGTNADGAQITYYFNYSGKPVSYAHAQNATELLSGASIQAGSTQTLGAWEFHILKNA